MNDLRLCEIQSLIKLSSIPQVCYFHKWFDGVNNFNNEPLQYAIVEFEDGIVKKVDIENNQIRFFSESESSDFIFKKNRNFEKIKI